MSMSTMLLPFPAGGLNARDPLEAMSPLDAIEMSNIIPRGAYGEFPGNASVFHDGAGSLQPVKTIITAPYRDTGEKVFVAYNGKIVYILTATTETDLETGQTSDIWQHAFINNTLVMVNGADQPQQISSTPTSSDAVYTGIADDALLLDVTVYKDRLYFIEKDTTKMWYGAANATTGALTEFNLASVLKLGGTLTWIGSWTQSTGTGIQDFLIIMSSQGEMLVYEGSDPVTAWNLAGRFYVGKPLATRGKKNIGADLWFLTREGMLSAADVLGNNGVAGKYRTLTDKIQNLYRELVALYGAAVGWEIAQYPKYNLIIINVPPTQDFTVGYGYQLIFNADTGAWSTLVALYDAWCWTLFSDGPLYGGRTATGKAFVVPGSVLFNSYAAAVSWAPNDLGARGFDKHIQQARPYLSNFNDSSTGSGTLTVGIGMYSVGGSNSVATVASRTVANGDLYQWVGATTYGDLIYPRLSFTVDDIQCRINSVQVMLETSGEPF